jgi:hypothetical protein
VLPPLNAFPNSNSDRIGLVLGGFGMDPPYSGILERLGALAARNFTMFSVLPVLGFRIDKPVIPLVLLCGTVLVPCALCHSDVVVAPRTNTLRLFVRVVVVWLGSLAPLEEFAVLDRLVFRLVIANFALLILLFRNVDMHDESSGSRLIKFARHGKIKGSHFGGCGREVLWIEINRIYSYYVFSIFSELATLSPEVRNLIRRFRASKSPHVAGAKAAEPYNHSIHCTFSTPEARTPHFTRKYPTYKHFYCPQSNF